MLGSVAELIGIAGSAAWLEAKNERLDERIGDLERGFPFHG